MSHEERNAWTSLAGNLAINAWVVWRLNALRGSGALDGPDAPQVWAQLVVWVIVASVILVVSMTVLFNVGYAIVSRGDAAAIRDERDHLFENRGMGMTMAVIAIGFVAGFAALAWGVRPVTVFIILYFAFALGSLAGDAVRLATYRGDC